MTTFGSSQWRGLCEGAYWQHNKDNKTQPGDNKRHRRTSCELWGEQHDWCCMPHKPSLMQWTIYISGHAFKTWKQGERLRRTATKTVKVSVSTRELYVLEQSAHKKAPAAAPAYLMNGLIKSMFSKHELSESCGQGLKTKGKNNRPPLDELKISAIKGKLMCKFSILCY